MEHCNDFRNEIITVLFDWHKSNSTQKHCGYRIIEHAYERLTADLVFAGFISPDGASPTKYSKEAIMVFVMDSLEYCESSHQLRFNTNLNGYRALISEIADAVISYQEG